MSVKLGHRIHRLVEIYTNSLSCFNTAAIKAAYLECSMSLNTPSSTKQFNPNLCQKKKQGCYMYIP